MMQLPINLETAYRAVINISEGGGQATVNRIAEAIGVHKTTARERLNLLAEAGALNKKFGAELIFYTPRAKTVEFNQSGKIDQARVIKPAPKFEYAGIQAALWYAVCK